VQVPNLNVAAMITGSPGSDPNAPLNGWFNPAVLGAMKISRTWDPSWPDADPGFAFAQGAYPAPVLRSDADETTYYLEQFLKAISLKSSDVATSPWGAMVRLVDPKADPATFAISERLPRPASTVTRDGAQEQVHQLGLGGADPSSGTISDLIKGVIAAAPASSLGDVRSAFPKQQFELVAMQNASNDWVAATPDSITAAVAAGGDTPLYALTNAASGAYPLAWVDRLYAPAHGLSVDKTEALATTIRYLATDGQDAAPKAGEGKLSDKLVGEALAAADQLVQSNCTGSDRTVVKSSDPGRFAPRTAGMTAIGPMLHCEAAAAPSTTVAVAAASSGPAFGSSSIPLSNSPIPALPALAAPASAPAPQSTPPSKQKKTILGALAASSLPEEQPGSGNTVDDAATFLLGAGLFLLARKPVTKLLARRTA
jgi:hypothetical protein